MVRQKQTEETTTGIMSREECLFKELHNKETLISAFDGRICKRCLRK